MPDAAPPTRPAGLPTAGLGLILQPAPGAPPVCSRKGCRRDAAWRLLWNNPRIHAAERRKEWASCPSHVEWFEEYLRDRDLWKETRPLAGGTPGGATLLSASDDDPISDATPGGVH